MGTREPTASPPDPMHSLLTASTVLGALLCAGSALSPSANEPVETHWPNGQLRERYALNEEGERSGPYQSWYEDGARHVRSRYRNGVLDGAYDSWHPDGERWVETGYKRGQLHGRYEERFAESELELEGRYKNGAADGVFELRDDGDLILVQEWDEGLLEELDGVRAHPREGAELFEGLDAILRDRSPASEDALELERDAALARLQQYRYLCGVPWDELRRDETFEAHAQAGAELCQRIGRLSHTPDNPGMDEDEYRFAYRGTSSSNLSMGPGIPGSIDNYMDDSDPSNIDRVGHRRWCLNPPMRKTGFGKAGRFSAMWSFDASGGGSHSEPILYPPAGYVPTDMFGAHYAWSALLPGGRGRNIAMEELSIQIQALDERYLPMGEPLELNYLTRTNGMLIFRPSGLVVEPGARYLARLEGLPKSGGETELVWLVEFTQAEAFEGESGAN